MPEKRKHLSAEDIKSAIKDSIQREREKKQQMVQNIFQRIMDKIEAGDYLVKGGSTMMVSLPKSEVNAIWSDLISMGKVNDLDISYGYNEWRWFRMYTVVEIRPTS